MFINNHDWKEAILFWDQPLIKNDEIDVYYRLHEFQRPTEGKVSEHINFRTHLNADTPESKFSSSTRRKIKKINPDISYKIEKFDKEKVELFLKEFNDFATRKNLTKLNKDYVISLATSDKTYISFATLNDEIQFIHLFYISDKISRLIYSVQSDKCTDFNSNIGLHLYELNNFKDLGVETYDWGGAGKANETDEKKLSIREFKRRFGGEEFTYYKTRIAFTDKGKEIVEKYYKV